MIPLYQQRIIDNLDALGSPWFLVNGTVLCGETARLNFDKVQVLQVSYTDLNNNKRIMTYLEEGPAGSRWLDETGYMLTIDLIFNKDGTILNPWDNAKDKTFIWVDRK